MTSDENAWVGSTITYSRQPFLQEKFQGMMESAAGWLHSHHYTGPVGADILETSSGEMSIVDLNVRTSGSMCLPLLKGHFTCRGLDSASSFQITTKSTREEFINSWKGKFEKGEIVVLSWYGDRESGKCVADVAVGGKDEEALRGVMKRVRETAEEMTS